SRLTRVIDYPARDMTVTVEAGIRIEELSQLLAKEHQRLPLDIAQPHRATLGGAIATNCSGPRRFGHGTLRDYVIGITAIDAGGLLFKAGGRVVKNVAGYDLCKMLIGSQGTLAVITQVTLKLRPIPEACAWLWMSVGQWRALEPLLARLLTSAARPVAVEVLDPQAAADIGAEARVELPAGGPVLGIAVEGLSADVRWQLEQLSQELRAVGGADGFITLPSSEALWAALTEFQTATEEPLTFQANLLPSRTVEFLEQAHARRVRLQAHAGTGSVIGHLPDEVSSATAAEEILGPLRQLARSAGGNLVIVNCEEQWKSTLSVFGEPESSWSLMRKLKAELDPHDLLNRGRMWR
ncbi:MAG TPA: FAD-binding oxidoreductase, partial [Planctomycetaceae bacterium]|nr:FAD-binding oxidoreductase [Planctomycetaceae bacterium]